MRNYGTCQSSISSSKSICKICESMSSPRKTMYFVLSRLSYPRFFKRFFCLRRRMQQDGGDDDDDDDDDDNNKK